MINDKSFLNKEMFTIRCDNLVNPMDAAMFWIEYVCQHKRAKHLKSHAINMSWLSYLLLVFYWIFNSFYIVICCHRKSNVNDKTKYNE